MPGPLETSIHQKLDQAFEPLVLQVLNESHQHSGPGTETHFKVVVVSESFAGKGLVARHRAVNAVLADELAAGVHALSINAHTQAQWEARGGVVPDSPRCRGGE